MFRVRAATRKSTKRATSPFHPTTDPEAPVPTPNPLSTAAQTPAIIGGGSAQATLANLLEAETVATLTTKPWLRLERGFRIQKLRAFAEAYPGLSAAEKEGLHAFLVRANDSKQLNTKSQITYEEGRIQAIKGLRVIRSGDPTEAPIFKIDGGRQTKRVSHSSTAATTTDEA
jgi:hypothetical protein